MIAEQRTSLWSRLQSASLLGQLIFKALLNPAERAIAQLPESGRYWRQQAMLQLAQLCSLRVEC